MGKRAGVALALSIASVGPLAAQQVQLPGITVTSPAAKVKSKPKAAASKAAPVTSAPAVAPADPSEFGAVLAIDPRANDVGIAQSASQGTVPAEVLLATPAYRTGEVLEAVPGLIVTQHSGEGKANQYFLRGFNLDHGTDIAITIDGMPVNMRTHGHGQGYADTAFMIPEIMRGLAFRKGPYFAAEGDFASAGAVHLDIVDKLERNFAQVEVGSFGHRRAVTGMSAPVGVDGIVLVAGELQHFNGPWEHPDELRKLNGVMRFARGTYDNGFALTAMAYSGKWNATSQIPLRAVDGGLIGRFGNLDPTDYGEAQRFSLSGRWHETTATTATRINAYAIKSDLKLFHNFTYFLNDPVNGDQFKQSDDRVIVGANASRTYFGTAFGVRSETTVGIQTRYDDIAVGLFNTRERVMLSTVRDDRVREASAGVFGENTLRWTDWLRTTVGLRGDVYWTDVASNIAANSGRDSDAILSPKAGLVLGSWAKTELYLNAGTGFHSNDARGTVTTIDPVSGDPAARTPFLVRSKGAEVGLRTQPWKGFLSTLSFFVLDFDSEIVFVGDAGNTEASRPSRRLGSELTFNAKLAPWLTADFSAAYTQARFREDDPDAPGRHIPGAVEGVVAAGLSFNDVLGGWFGGVKVRYFGPRPLIEDNSERSEATTTVSARLGYKFASGLIVRLDGFNLLDAKASQIDYFYASRLPGEPAGGVEDKHFHPVEPRSFRLSATMQW
ncbi:TonB-dependent receptor [Hyphomicrobium sp. CS1BSMeth3]|uniref:TonB-dependent receptor n=1 Tax=Hyphomicrobium sp. CS1BSMeth3 TaxID=1892844 RepID=UPI000930D5E8|nr:TonB-dependent receptor [Hyphomicrobium sp. CS1BSMeth3]